MSRKEIGMVFACSGVGKSIWLCKTAIKNIIKGNDVLLISCEMSEAVIVGRIMSMLTGLNGAIFKDKELFSDNIPEIEKRWNSIAGNSKLGKLRIKEFSAGCHTISDMRLCAKKLERTAELRPDVVVLDYIDEVKSRNVEADAYTSQYQTTREFRAWMMEENMCGFTATQANRQGIKAETITSAEMGDSIGKVRVVDALWSLNQTEAERKKKMLRIFVEKHRNGRSKYTAYGRINYDTLSMHEIDQQEYEQAMQPALDGE